MREYVGAEGSELAELAAEVDKLERLERLAQQEARREERERERKIVEWVEAVFPAAHWLLLESGCYQKKRRWRMARTQGGLAKVEAQKQDLKPLEEMTAAELEAQDRAGRAGVEEVLTALYWRQYREKALSWAEMLEIADPGSRVMRKMVIKHFQRNWREGRLQTGLAAVLLQNLLPSKFENHAIMLGAYEEMRQKLAGPDPSMMETMLAESAALAWLHSTVADMKHAGIAGTPHAAHYLRAGESAQRRMNRALRTLATVRRLMVPPLLLVQARQVGNTPASLSEPASPPEAYPSSSESRVASHPTPANI